MKSEKSLACLFRFLIALLILEIVCGLAIASACEYLKVLVQNRIFQFNKHEALSVVFIVKLFGIHISFCFFCGVPLIMTLNDVYTRHMSILLKFWLLMALETAIGSLFIIWCITDVSRFLVETFEQSLMKGITLYPTDPLWVLIWDDMQYEFACCGVYDHNDWMKINLTTRGRKSTHFSWMPYSCANGNIPSTETLSDENIHTNGCYHAMKSIIDYVTVSVVWLNIVSVLLLVRFFLRSNSKIHATQTFSSTRLSSS